jgi:acyl dehydratase
MEKQDMPAGDQPLYLEDIAVGRRFTTGSHAIDETQIKAFAEQFDPQPFHVDAEAAAASSGPIRRGRATFSPFTAR